MFNFRKKMVRQAHHKSKNKGFSLIELMVSVALFSVVMTISMGAIMSILDSNRKAQSLKSVMNNLNFALEDMTRTIKTGFLQSCPSDHSNITVNRINSSGISETINYFSQNSQIFVMNANAGGTFPITAPEITIEGLNFYCSQSGQPRVMITIKGHAGVDVKTRSDFHIQTTVSQRLSV